MAASMKTSSLISSTISRPIAFQPALVVTFLATFSASSRSAVVAAFVPRVINCFIVICLSATMVSFDIRVEIAARSAVMIPPLIAIPPAPPFQKLISIET
ncbi:MAG: hypothetical protein M3400_13450 [Actinomycetota bacterium]|nr:hypothetical protein [Actinomycetota bacterium]